MQDKKQMKKSKPVFEDWLTLTPRRNRLSYFLASLVILAATRALQLLAHTITITALGAESGFAFAVTDLIGGAVPFAFWLILSAQRLRDLNIDGRWAFIFAPGYFANLAAAAAGNPPAIVLAVDIIGFAFLVAFLVLLFAPGTKGKNRFGADPITVVSNKISEKSIVVALLCNLLLGFLGIHRFYVGKPDTGIFMILTLGGFGIWIIIDMIIILTENFTDAEGKNLVWKV